MSRKKDFEKWFELTIEEPINPDIPICDPHHHLWNEPKTRGRYLIEDYLNDVGSGHNIVKTVFIQCGTGYRRNGPTELQPVGETEFVCRQVGQNVGGNSKKISVADGIVAYADLLLGIEVAPVIEAHIEAANKRLKGIRQICIWDSDPSIISMGNMKGMMMESSFRKGFECIRNYGLVFDAWQYYSQLPELKDLAEDFPDTTIVVNHLGGILGIGSYKSRHKEVFDEWKNNIAELAKCPNIFMKLGGLGMPRCGFDWHQRSKPIDSVELAHTIRPYFDVCIEKFGIDRCMFESNFPIDKVSYSYTVLWNAFKRLCKEFSYNEQAALLHDNAVRVYKLN